MDLLKSLKGKVAVYIDAANLEQSVKALGQIPPSHAGKHQTWKANKIAWSVDYQKLRRLFEKSAQYVSLNFYTPNFNTPSHQGFLTYLKKNGYRIVTKPVKKIKNQDAQVKRKCKFCGAANSINISFTCQSCSRKNDVPIERKANFDVEIATDAINWAGKYDTFVLFSGDSDFVYLTQILKSRYKKTVIVLSRRGHIADELRKSPFIDLYIDWYELKDLFLIARKAVKTPKSAFRRI